MNLNKSLSMGKTLRKFINVNYHTNGSFSKKRVKTFSKLIFDGFGASGMSKIGRVSNFRS